MGIFKNKKLNRKIAMVFASTLILTSVVQASSLTKKIDATFRNIKVFYNNQQKTMEQEPFIYNGSVYLPVRAVSELVDKNVQWNSSTNSVFVSDKGSSVSNTVLDQLRAEITAKNFEIAKITAEKTLLENRIKELEGNKGGSSSGSLKDTLKYIEDEFDYEYSIDWDFDLKETSSRINVEVSFDSRTDGRKWENLSKSKKESFFRDIAREIRADHKDVTINGKVLDRRTDKTVGTFSYSRSNSFSYSDEGSYSLSELERDLVRKYRKIKDTNLTIDNISLRGDEDDIIFTVVVNLSTRELEREWEDLRKDRTVIRDFLLDIEEDILYDYRYANVEGYIEDYAHRNEVLVSFDNGSVSFR